MLISDLFSLENAGGSNWIPQPPPPETTTLRKPMLIRV